MNSVAERRRRRPPVPSRIDLLKACDMMESMAAMMESAPREKSIRIAFELANAGPELAASLRVYLEQVILQEAMVGAGRKVHEGVLEDEDKTDPPSTTTTTDVAPAPPASTPDAVDDVIAKPGQCIVCSDKKTIRTVEETGIVEVPCPACVK